ncbi:MAG: phosphoglycerate kinase [Gemmatimonadetes bacterium]|nr:phosphoglycerate kinase [Gemmatimonadota bacterium]
MRTLSDLTASDLQNRRLLVRLDYNVPLDGNGEVSDRTRIDATIPSIERLRRAGARVLLVSHLGRPGGQRAPSSSLRPIAAELSRTLGTPVPLLEDLPGTKALEAAVAALRPGEVALLENIRFHPGETRNDPDLCRSLADLADAFVGDAFGAAHRTHASTVGAARVIRDRGGPVVAGVLMARELHFLDRALRTPGRPFVAIMGGAKISGKIDVIRAILPRVDRLLVGGAMANTFLRALGFETGASFVEEDRVPMARDLMEEAGDKLLLPVDCVVADELTPADRTRDVDRAELPSGVKIGDIGPRSREIFSREASRAATVLWNGPLGVFEIAPFSRGTFHLARSLAEAADRGAVVVVGGGDSAAAAQRAGVAHRMTHISTGGGASLDLLAGKELPGVAVLDTVEAPDHSELWSDGVIGG